MKPKSPDASRVWQRVLSPEPGEQQTLQTLIRQLHLDLGFLKQYSKSDKSPLGEQLIREYNGQILSLKGILQLTGGSLPREGGHLPDHSLRRCYDHALRRLGSYQLRSSDPVYGPVFRELAGETQGHCLCITQLLGNTPHNSKINGR